MVSPHFAIRRPLRNSAPHSESNSRKSQNPSSTADATSAAGVASSNWRSCSTESGSYCVSEDGCLIDGCIVPQ
jgi:hypothetical protein